MSASVWAPGTTISANSSIQSEAFTATAGQTLFTLTNFEYTRNSGTLYVYVAGKLQRPGVDVFETSVSSFTLSTGAPEGAIVVAVAFTEVTVTVPLTSASQELFTATGGQTVFNTTAPYNPGGDTLAVYVNGLRLFPNEYVENSTNTFTLNTGLTAGDEVLAIIKEDLMISDPVNIAAGTINGTTIGNTNPAAGTFTNLTVTGNTVLGDASADTLTINAGTVTIPNASSFSRTLVNYPAGASATLQFNTSGTADAGGTTAVFAGVNFNNTLNGANAAVSFNGTQSYAAHNGTATLTTLIGGVSAATVINTGNATTAYAHYGSLHISNTGSITSGAVYAVGAPTFSSTGVITNLTGLTVNNIGNAKITTAVGVSVSDITTSANIRAVRLQVSSGSGKYNMYAEGTADNYFAGSVGIGALPTSDRRLNVLFTGASTSALDYGIYSLTNATATSGAFAKVGIIGQCSSSTGFAGTGALVGLYGVGSHAITTTIGDARGVLGFITNTSTGTITNAYTLFASNATNGGGGVISNLFGLYVSDLTVGAANYGITSLVSAGTSKWNLYLSGTAQNYIAGNLGLGVLVPTAKLDISGGGIYVSAEDATAEIQINRASTNSGGVFQYFNKARGTLASRTIVAASDSIGNVTFRGYDGSAYIAAASISSIVDGTPGANDMPGALVFATTADGASSATDRLKIDTAGNARVISNTGGLGYGVGSGTTVTQLTSKATSVTINTPSGKITMNNAALAAGVVVGFSVNNSVFADGDVVVPMIFAGATTNSYNLWAVRNSSGVFNIYLQNISAGSLSEAVEIMFVIIKGSTS